MNEYMRKHDPDSDKVFKKNMWMFPLGTVGRDMVYSLWTNFLLLFILYTQNLTNAQLAAVTAIMVAARVFDALNDPIMGNIIERTRTRWGKYKPWLLIGIGLTSVVVYLVFNTNLQGWGFIWLFGICYFFFSIAFTMHDISYYGMIPALSSDGDRRNQITARTTLMAGIGGTLASIVIPLLTTGNLALGGSAKTAYGRIALLICILSPLFLCFTLFGAFERREDEMAQLPPVSFRKIIGTFAGNDQLIWISVIFLLQEIGNGIVIGGTGSNYIYFEFGYEGGLYSTFTTVGMLATAFLMVFYPNISRKIHRKKLVSIMLLVAVAGYAIQLAVGLILPSSMVKFWILTFGFMLANFGQYGTYLVFMISIINTVEYNEYKHGIRDEAIISSVRPFLTKLAGALTVVITTGSYMLFRVTHFTNQISELEQAAERGSITLAEKSSRIADVLAGVGKGQTCGLLFSMTLVPCAFLIICCLMYGRYYQLDEERYEEICKKINR